MVFRIVSAILASLVLCAGMAEAKSRCVSMFQSDAKNGQPWKKHDGYDRVYARTQECPMGYNPVSGWIHHMDSQKSPEYLNDFSVLETREYDELAGKDPKFPDKEFPELRKDATGWRCIIRDDTLFGNGNLQNIRCVVRCCRFGN